MSAIRLPSCVDDTRGESLSQRSRCGCAGKAVHTDSLSFWDVCMKEGRGRSEQLSCALLCFPPLLSHKASGSNRVGAPESAGLASNQALPALEILPTRHVAIDDDCSGKGLAFTEITGPLIG